MTLMVVVCFNYVLKQTFRKWPELLFSAVVAGMFVAVMWPYAIEQSKTQIQDWLSDAVLMKDTAVLLTADVAVQLAYCMISAHVMTSGKLGRKTVIIYKVLRFIPSLLFYPVLFSGLVVLMFSVHGMEFSTLAWMMDASVFLSVPLLTWLLRTALPEKELRLELLFLGNVIVLLLGIVSTVNGQTAVEGTNAVDWSAFAGMSAVVLTGACIGMALRRLIARRSTRCK